MSAVKPESKPKSGDWKVHIFSDCLMDELMRRINAWFEDNPRCEVRLINQSSAPLIGKDGTSTITVTISVFYTG